MEVTRRTTTKNFGALCGIACLFVLHGSISANDCDSCIDLGLDAIPACGADAFYVDAENGSDSNSGAMSSPWATLSKARNTAPSGATICLQPGNYGSYAESSPPAINQRQTVRGIPGQSAPIFSGIAFGYSSIQDAHLTMSGITVRGETTGDVVKLNRTKNLRLNDFDIQNFKWAINNVGVIGLEIRETEGTVIDNTTISNIHRGVQVISSSDTRILRNFISPKAGTGIQYVGGNTNGEIAYNNIQGSEYVGYPENPDAPIDPHASIISVRSSDVTIRGNHLHGMGTSSGVMFYTPDAAGGEDAYSNVLIENNAIYHSKNTYALRVYNLGSNFIVRNNTLFSRIRTGDCNGATKDARYRYSSAMIVHSKAPGSEGIRLYNNLMIGIASIGADNIYEEANNYVWSWNSSGWLSTSPSGTSEIITSSYSGCGNHKPVFEDGTVLKNFDSLADFSFTREPLDLSPAPNSPVINFGSPAHQPAFSLGNVQSDGFVELCAPKRSVNHFSAGAYEVGSCTNPEPDPAPPPLALENNQWRQVSLPCDPGGNNTVESLFGDDNLGEYGQDWIIWEFDAARNQYSEINLQSLLRQGVGYWILQKTGSTQQLRMPDSCAVTTKQISTNCPAIDGCFSVPVVGPSDGSQAGQYQMHGYPFAYVDSVDATTISSEAGSCTSGCALGSSNANTYVEPAFWSYDGAQYQELKSGESFSPWSGFWSLAYPAASDTSVEILFGQSE